MRKPIERIPQYDKHVPQVAGKLLAESASDLSDTELDRCLQQTVLPIYCIAVARYMRDTLGYTLDDLRRQF